MVSELISFLRVQKAYRKYIECIRYKKPDAVDLVRHGKGHLQILLITKLLLIMTKSTFLTKFKYAIGILGLSLFLIFAACVKEVVNNQSQVETEKAELLKAKGEMSKSFKSMADVVRTTGKKHFGAPHNGGRFNDQAFFKDLTDELARVNPDFQANPAIRLNKVWNPKTESLRDYMSGIGTTQNVIEYSQSLKEKLETTGKQYGDQIEAGKLDTKSLLASISQVFQDMEKKVIEDPKLTESEKLALLASTTAGLELTPAWAEVYQDFKLNLINRTESWSWLRAIGNAIISIAIVVAVVIVVAAVAVAIGAATGGLGWAAIGAFLSTAPGFTLMGGGATVITGILLDCRGVCVFPDDDCYCN